MGGHFLGIPDLQENKFWPSIKSILPERLHGLLEEFGRSFIGKLDPTVREKFAYENAERLLSSSKQKAE